MQAWACIQPGSPVSSWCPYFILILMAIPASFTPPGHSRRLSFLFDLMLFQIMSSYIVQAGVELTFRLPSLPSAGITGVSHHGCIPASMIYNGALSWESQLCNLHSHSLPTKLCKLCLIRLNIWAPHFTFQKRCSASFSTLTLSPIPNTSFSFK